MPFLLSNQQRQSTESTRYINFQAADCLIIAVANGQRETDHNANCATASAPHQQPPSIWMHFGIGAGVLMT